MERSENLAGGGKRMNHNTPLTPEQRELAARHHQTIYSYLRGKRLDASEWYDVAVFGYLRAVRLYTERPELQRYSFTTIAGKTMSSEIDKERRKERRRIQPLSLDAELNEDGLTLYGLIGDPKFLPYQQEDEVVAAQYMPLLEVLTEQQLAVLTMKAQGYTYREIAEALGLNTWRAAASTADRGRQAIRRAEDKRSDALKARTDKELGWCTPADLFRECEAYARRKLALNKLRTGDSYGENYLALLTADTIRERAFSRYTIKRYELEAAI